MESQQFFESIKGKKIAVLGIGISNTPLISMLLSKGAIVTACDRRSEQELGDVAAELKKQGAILKLGDNYLKDLDCDIIFRTPGMRFNLPELVEAHRKGMAVTSEMEVFFDVCPAKIFAVTGSDGKTTTTTIISEFLKKQGYKVHLGGNIGRPLLPDIEKITPDDMIVVELSSFQLITMRKSPDVAVLTNIELNHLDVHKNMKEYIGAKKNIYLHQNAFGRAVFNEDNKIASSLSCEARGAVYSFSRLKKVEFGAYLGEDGIIYMSSKDGIHPIMKRDDIMIIGNHNVENFLAAITATWGYVTPENMLEVARTFSGVEHRIEFVRELDGVRYFNDSIATSPSRTIAGLNSFRKKVILIAGGYDKHIPFEVLAPKIIEKVKYLILLGNTSQKIKDVVVNHPDYRAQDCPIIQVNTLQEAVETAKNIAQNGDIITLSPACASFDMFKNFEIRGNAYKEIVYKLDS